MTGSIAAAVFVLAIGGLVAFGAGLFDQGQDSGTSGSADQAGPPGEGCPRTGGSDQPASFSPAGAADARSTDGGCCPSMTKTPASAAPAESADGCSGCSSAAAGCGEKKECSGEGTCDACSAGN
jgi:hypothetical protein